MLRAVNLRADEAFFVVRSPANMSSAVRAGMGRTLREVLEGIVLYNGPCVNFTQVLPTKQHSRLAQLLLSNSLCLSLIGRIARANT